MAVDPSALVEGDLAGITVRQFASVVRGARVGRGTSIGACSVVDGSVVGEDCRIGSHVSIPPGVEIGDQVFVGPGVVFCNDVWPSVSREGFEMDRLLSGLVTVRVGDGAVIGAAAVILPGVKIGKGAFIAAGAVVSGDVPAGQLWTRSGEIAAIPTDRMQRRMRLC